MILITTGGMGCLGKSEMTAQLYEKLLTRFDNHHLNNQHFDFIAFDGETIKQLKTIGINGNGIVIFGTFKDNKYKSGNDNLPFQAIGARMTFFKNVIVELNKIEMFPAVILNEGYFNMQSYSWYELETWKPYLNIEKHFINIGYYESFDEFNEWQRMHRSKSKINSKNLTELQMQSRLKTFNNHNTKFQKIISYIQQKNDDRYQLQRIPFSLEPNYIQETLTRALQIDILKEKQ